MRKKRIILTTSVLFLLSVSIIFVIASCSLFQPACQTNNTGTLTVKNNTNDDIRVRIDGVNYGFLSIGETLKRTFAAGVKYTVETLWPDGSPACSPAEVTVIQCQTQGISCSAVHKKGKTRE